MKFLRKSTVKSPRFIELSPILNNARFARCRDVGIEEI